MVTKLSSEIALQCKKKCCTMLAVAHFSSPPAEVGGDEKCVQNFNWET
jgi:hypothetical protein